MSVTSRTAIVNTVEGHIVIGKDRRISVPNVLKRIAVQYDHNVETVTFDCPRYWDGYDMSKMNVYINYVGPKGDSGMYKATNIEVDKYYVTTMHFDWSITKNVSMIPGNIEFQVCIKKIDADGNEEIHWNSEVCKDCYVSESLDCDGSEIVEQYPDIIEQWYQSLPAVQITDIEGGHRVVITDVSGSQSFDVMDTYIESSDAVLALLDRFATVSAAEPTEGPAIWFDLDDKGTKSGVIKVKDADGTVREFYPYTHFENVSGLNELETSVDTLETSVDTLESYFVDGVTSIAHGGTGATDAATARKNLGAAEEGHTHEVESYFVGSVASIAHGGTGASNAAAARKNLGAAEEGHTHEVESYFVGGVASITHGGTGASDAETARKNLGAAPEVHTHNMIDLKDCGDELPTEIGTPGRIFYKKVIE